MIAAIRKLVLGERRDNENFSFPYWVIVQPRWGNDILLAGVWFSREDAEHHLKCHGDVFGRRAVVRCMSAVRAESGLRKLYLDLMSEDVAPAPKSPPSGASYSRGSAGMNAAMNAAKQWRNDLHEGEAMMQRLEDALSMFRPSINETVESIKRMRAFLTQPNTPPDYPEVEPEDVEAGQPTSPAPIDYPKVALEDVIVGRAYWVRGTPGRGGPYIVHARVDPRDQKMQFFDGHACGNTMYRRDIAEIYGPIPLPSGLSSEVEHVEPY